MPSITSNTTPSGSELRAAREALGLTQVQLARQASLSSGNYVSAIERGLVPGDRTLARLAKVLQLDTPRTSSEPRVPISSRAAGGSTNA